MLPICIYRCYLYLIGGTAPNGTGFKMLNMDMTPAQKAARTRAMKKAWAKYDEHTKPFDDAYYAFAETLYPERDRIIDEAYEEKERIIAEAEAKYQAIRDAEMAKFDKAMETLDAERTKNRHEASEILKQETAQFDIWWNN